MIENPFNELKQDLEEIKNLLKKVEAPQQKQKEVSDNFFDEYIPKSEARDKLASASTLWKYEKAGKLPVYGIGGKRFYKKADLEKAFIKLNKTESDEK